MDITPKFLIESAAAGRQLRGLNLAGIVLRGLNLDGLCLRNCGLEGADLSGASLRHAIFEDVYVSRANFTAAQLDAGHFQNVAARLSLFNGASMVGLDWRGGRLEHSFIVNADARNSRWSSMNITGAIWSGTNLAYADLRGLDDWENLVRWHACGTGEADDRAALALYNNTLGRMSEEEARNFAESWRQRLGAIRSSGVSDFEAAALMRLEMAAVYSGGQP